MNNNITFIRYKDQVLITYKNSSYWIKTNINKAKNLSEKNIYEILEKYDNNCNCEKKNINSIYWAVTQKCNMECQFCTMESGPTVSTINDLTTDDIENILLPQIQKMNPKKLIVTGGEPLVRKDILYILKILSEKLSKEKIILETNGLLLDNEILIKICRYVGCIEASVEHIVNNKILEDKLDLLWKLVNAKNTNLRFSFVVDTNNYRDIKEVLDYARRYNAELILRYLAPLGKGEHLSDKLFLSFMDRLVLQKQIANYILEKDLEKSSYTNLLFTDYSIKSHCSAMGKTMGILPNGDMCLCINFKESAFCFANLKFDSFKDVQKKWDALVQKTENIFCVDSKEMCKNCEYRYFCTGICAASYQTNCYHYIEVECRFRRAMLNYRLFEYNKEVPIRKNIGNYIDYITDIIEKKDQM